MTRIEALSSAVARGSHSVGADAVCEKMRVSAGVVFTRKFSLHVTPSTGAIGGGAEGGAMALVC